MSVCHLDLLPKSEADIRAIVKDIDPDNCDEAMRVFLDIDKKRVAKLERRVQDLSDKLKESEKEAKRLNEKEAMINESLARLDAEQQEQLMREQSQLDMKIPDQVKKSHRIMSEYKRPERHTDYQRHSSAKSAHKQQYYDERHSASRNLETMVDHELRAQKVKDTALIKFHEKAEERQRELDKKMAAYEHIMSDHEKKALMNMFQKRLDRDMREFEVEVNRRAYQYMQKLKAEKIIETDKRIHKLKHDRDDFKKKREVIKGNLLKDISRMKAGDITTDQLRTKYSYLQYDQELNGLFASDNAEHSYKYRSLGNMYMIFRIKSLDIDRKASSWEYEQE